MRSLLASLVALLLAGCAGLRPLPPPSGRTCDRGSGPTGTVTFWECLQEGNRPAARTASAYTSTFRVYRGDLRRKLRDQRPGRACSDRPFDSRFTVISGAAVPGAGVPLRAFFFPGNPELPAVIVVHGLFDSKASRYLEVTARFLADRGFGVLVPDMRWHGCLLTPEPRELTSLGLGEARDLAAWSGWLREQPGGAGRPIGLVGFSLGALDVLHALSQEEAPERFAAGGIAVCPPGDLQRSVDRLDRPIYLRDMGLSGFFLHNFRQSLTTRLRAQHLSLPGLRDGCSAPGLFSRAICLLAGTGDPGELIRAAEPGPRIRATRVPLLVLSTRDDPIFSEAAAVALNAAAQGNTFVRVVETPHGGHIGQLGLYPEWMAETIERFFGAAAASPTAAAGK